MKIDVIKIHAEGCYKRFMRVKINDFETTIRIPEKLYIKLKEEGTPTSQWLRYHKEDLK